MSILPENLARYQKFLSFMLKYWNSDLLNETASNAMDEETARSFQDYEQTPEELVEDLKQMGPTYIKLGQLLSTRPDLLPDRYLEALSSLQDDLPTIPYAKVQEIIENELGIKISKSFNSFEEEPLASASIGQVHLAELRSGKTVAVKVQRPGIRKKFMDDLDTLEEMADLAVKHTEVGKKYGFNDVLAELRRIMLHELDYLREANNLVTLGINLKDYRRLIVPQPIPDYTTSRVLTMEYVKGKKITSVSPLKKTENDYLPLVDELIEAYLKQIVSDGFVHADPHPGNIHLLENEKIALMDLGMVAQFSKQMKEHLLRLLLGLSKNDGEEIADILLNMSDLTDHVTEKEFRREISIMVQESSNSTAKDMQTGKLLIQMNRSAAMNGIHLPVEVNILGKILLNMDQIIAFLAPEYDLREAVRKYMSKLLQNKMVNELKPEEIFSVLLDSKKLVENLPDRLDKITENLARNNFRLQIDAIDEKRFTDGFQKVANRITLGLIIAAMIMGAAMLMSVPSPFTIFGYPGLAIIFFMLAAVAGIYLSYTILFKDE
ncbi:Predicted unusual protein kinase regulating ubiquinone biosynthesis, AarF/ABC1/UbiB family [Salinimicrobium sediminis]|uniref:Predicted unusual protein kinase regulating ubiquinone biosynthesis, AarF/ABC1/UbiB family n=1 Tax=Salinimicrobium sediminis TaxID=1343891 RepID=A0A285X4M7_9FLAO|nr:AarF/UbiB family protein [Salinimicrobium sediminis]SOC80303.1 Predicted unusual protein kinase regulating ubiquinone biosynthesis, AarF/ABC1/UbiB family [Salinimicrobium sediminis]